MELKEYNGLINFNSSLKDKKSMISKFYNRIEIENRYKNDNNLNLIKEYLISKNINFIDKSTYYIIYF